MTVIHPVLIHYDIFLKEHLRSKHMTHTRKIKKQNRPSSQQQSLHVCFNTISMHFAT